MPCPDKRVHLWLLLLIPLWFGCAASEQSRSLASEIATGEPHVTEGTSVSSFGMALPSGAETVVLVHGLGRTRASMLVLYMRLSDAGYRVANFPYNHAGDSLDEISAQLLEFIGSDAERGRYHLIGHSLGNVIIRNAFRTGYPPGLGRIVMLAPPNRPAHLAESLEGTTLYRWIAGDSGQQLASEEFYRELPVPDVDFGVIAGDRGHSLTFDEPNDGVIAVATTRLDGMADFLVLHHTHTFLMNTRDTFDRCLTFLRHGRFEVREP